jgi:hypothetical protein
VEEAGIHAGIKVQPPAAVTGHFPKDCFAIDLDGKTVTCPAGVTVPLRASGHKRHAAAARFGAACLACPLAAQCTADYRATRPKVERKIGHLMRRRTAAAAPASAASSKWPPTSHSSPPPSTSPGSPCWG